MTKHQELMQRVRSRRRRILRGCGITAGILLVLVLIGWYLATNHLGALLSSTVRKYASESINGRLEFADLKVDLGGRAVLKDVKVFEADATEPVFTCPKAVVSFDFVTFIGPNRGKRAVVVNLHEPWVRLVRKADGGFNLADLLKEPEGEATEPTGISLRLNDATVDFTDHCLLTQGYPRFTVEPGPLQDLLAELGYDELAPAPAGPHNEVLGATGSFNYNPQRHELSFDADFTRAGEGSFSVKGSGDSEMAGYEITITAREFDFPGIRQYIRTMFPQLELGLPGDAPLYEEGPPYLSGGLKSGRLVLKRQPNAESEFELELDLLETRLATSTLPTVHASALEFDYLPRRDQLSATITAVVAGLAADGNLKLNLESDELSAQFDVTADDLAQLAADLGFDAVPVSGSLMADLTVSGTSGDPVIVGQLKGGAVSVNSIELGRPGGTVRYSGGTATLENVQTSGGEVDVTASGSYTSSNGSGSFELATKGIPARRLVELASREGGVVPEISKDVTGEVDLSATVTITDNKPTAKLSASSALLKARGYSLAGFKVNGGFEGNSIRIDAATGTVKTPQPVSFLTFKSDGPLSSTVRIGGSVAYMEGSPMVLGLTGTAATTNMIGEQADASFKVIGPANDPELRIQIKTRHEQNPLTLTGTAHYREGMSPVTATVSWGDMSVDIDGGIDFTRQVMDAEFSAKSVRIEQIAEDKRFSGVFSVTGQAEGPISEPQVVGQLTVPVARFRIPSKTYEVSNGSLGFKVVGSEAASISNGQLTFNGQPFTFGGTLGRESGSIVLESTSFDLFNALAALPSGEGGKPPVMSVSSTGQLRAEISGQLTDPVAEITYDSGPGTVEGHKFTSASLRATARLDGVEITRLNIASSQGSASISGRIGLNPATYDIAADITNFDVAIVTPMIPSEALSSLTGTLNGKLALNGSPEQYSADGNLSLTDGTLTGIPIDSASADVRTSGQRLIVDHMIVRSGEGVAEAEGAITFDPLQIEASAQASGFNVQLVTGLMNDDYLSSLTGTLNAQLGYSGTSDRYSATGTVGLDNGSYQGVSIDSAKATLSAGGGKLNVDSLIVQTEGSTLTASGSIGTGLKDSKFDINAPDIDLKLLLPFMPDATPRLQGSVSLEAKVRQSNSRYPSLDITVRNAGGGVQAGAATLNDLEIHAVLDNDILTVERGRFAANGNTLDLSGTYDFGRDDPPLDLRLVSQDFSLDAIAGLLPEQYSEMLPSGTLQGDLQVKGSSRAPLLSGNARFELTALPDSVPLNISRATGSIRFSRNEFDIASASLTTNVDGAETTVAVVGNGTLSLVPFRLVQGGVTAALAPDGRFTRLRMNDLFDGTVGGTISVTAGGRNDIAAVSGSLVVNAPGEKSTIWLQPPERGINSEPVGYRLRDLGILFQPGTEFRYSPVDLRVQLEGALTLTGRPGLTHEPGQSASQDELAICGDVTVTKGSMFIYRHTLRLEGDTNRLHFSCIPGDMLPSFTGRGAVVLPRVLQGQDTTISGLTPVGSDRGDLKVILTFNHVKLDPGSGALDNIGLSSEPPLPVNQIKEYLLGGVTDVMAGRTEITEFAESELYSYGTGFISRALENAFNLEAFRFGGTGSGDNPFYVDMEKDISDKLTFTYYRDFFNQTGQTEEFGVRYNLLRGKFDGVYQNLDLSVNFEENGFTGPEREFMFEWTTRF